MSWGRRGAGYASRARRRLPADSSHGCRLQFRGVAARRKSACAILRRRSKILPQKPLGENDVEADHDRLIGAAHRLFGPRPYACPRMAFEVARQLCDETTQRKAAAPRSDSHRFGDRPAERNQRGLGHLFIGTGVNDLSQPQRTRSAQKANGAAAQHASVLNLCVFRLAPRLLQVIEAGRGAALQYGNLRSPLSEDIPPVNRGGSPRSRI